MSERLANKFLVGCDPEFAIINEDGSVVEAGEILGDYYDNEGVGVDGGGVLAELRPKPHPGTYAVLRQLQRLINSSHLRDARPYTWRAGALVEAPMFEHRCRCPQCLEENPVDSPARFPMGGHIHLDIHPTEPELMKTIEGLDRYTELLEHLDILPAKESAARRRDGDYGHYGAWRLSPDGGDEEFYDEDENGRVPEDQHIEYRTMPSWLFHPVPAYLALTGAKLVATAPTETLEAMSGRLGYAKLKDLFELFRDKDVNADRALDKVLDKPVEQLQFDPAVDFKESWEELPL